MKIEEITIGCDPELFVTQNGQLVSAYGLVEGDKKNPKKVDRGAVQVDGMALEFNTDPAKFEDEFILNVTSVMQQLKSMCPQHEFYINPVAHFGAEYINSQPDEAKELGCDPDYNAYTLRANKRPDANTGIRTASGHVHIGWGSDFIPFDFFFMEECAEVAKQMDFALGLPSLFYDDDTERRTLYGKGGAFRAKPYGVEYRTLSNAWLKDEKLMRWVFRQAKWAMEKFIGGEKFFDRYGDISEIINNSDKTEAIKIIQMENIAMPQGV